MATTYTVQIAGNTAAVRPWTPAVEAVATAHVRERKQVSWEELREMSPAQRQSACLETKKYELFQKAPDNQWGIIYGGLVHRLADTLRARGSLVNIVGMPTYAPVDLSKVDVAWRPRQREAVEQMLTQHCGIFKAAPGYGKSMLLCAACQVLPNDRILIVVTGKALLGQMAERLKAFGIKKVGMHDGERSPKADDRVIVCSARSLHKMHPQWPTALFFDEVHQAGAINCMTQLARFQSCRLFGLSANPYDRGDGAERCVEACFGPLVVDVTQQEACEMGCVLPVEVRLVRYQPRVVSEWMTPDAIERYGIWRHEERNRLIASSMRALQREGFEQILLTVSKVEHGLYLRKYLPEFTLVRGDVDDDRREDFRRQGVWTDADDRQLPPEKLRGAFSDRTLRWVLATKTWWTGVDFPHLRAVGRADGQSGRIAAEQIGGRVARVLSPEISQGMVKTHGVMVDIFDGHNNMLRRKSETRVKHYEDIGWKVADWSPPKEIQGAAL
jgi:superfamily II DNA or RNA helicase